MHKQYLNMHKRHLNIAFFYLNIELIDPLIYLHHRKQERGSDHVRVSKKLESIT